MMQSVPRVGAALVLALVVLALADKSSAQYCTPETCPPGPVIASFQYSNCTGDVLYQPYNSPYPLNECVNTSATNSFLYASTDDFLAFVQFVGSDDCGQINRASYTYGNSYYFGACILAGSKRSEQNLEAMGFPRGVGLMEESLSSRSSSSENAVYAAYAYLSNVNATIERQDPIPVSPEVPNLNDVAVEASCYSPNNCTVNGELPLYYVTSSTNDTCVEQTASEMAVNITNNECYRAGEAYYYTRLRCTGEHSISVETVSGDCGRILNSIFIQIECGIGYPQTLTCTAAPSPITIPVPSSCPSSSVNSFIMIAFILALIFSF